MNASETTKTAYIGIGSNLGDKLGNCVNAIDLIEKTPGLNVTARSPFFRTEPVGVKGQDWYLNGVIALTAHVSTHSLLACLLDIEEKMGRKRQTKWDARVIDLDILLSGQEIIKEEGLTVPHPLMHLRRFVLIPLARLAPDLIHPTLGMTMDELLAGLPENGQAVTSFTVA